VPDVAGPVVADTHTFAWYIRASSRLSDNARRTLRKATAAGYPVFVSAASLVELRYLVEKGTFTEEQFSTLLAALLVREATFELAPVDVVIAQAVGDIAREQVGDPFDRMIAATALAVGVPLVTADRKLRELSAVETSW
jgi:PIN domain nuclease of toxin-antitoxin system